MSKDHRIPLLKEHKANLAKSPPVNSLDDSSAVSSNLSEAIAKSEPELHSQLTLEIASQEAKPVSSNLTYNVPPSRAVVVHYWSIDEEPNHFYQQFNISRTTTVKEFIAMSLQYFETVAKTLEDTDLYELRFANKSGQPKEDLPGMS